MSAVVIAAASAATAASTVNSRRQYDEHCRGVVKNYDVKTATVKDMQEYSSCVQHLYPEKDNSDKIVGGACLTLIIFMLIGAIWGMASDQDTVGGVLAGIVLWFALLVALLLLAGASLLFI